MAITGLSLVHTHCHTRIQSIILRRFDDDDWSYYLTAGLGWNYSPGPSQFPSSSSSVFLSSANRRRRRCVSRTRRISSCRVLEADRRSEIRVGRWKGETCLLTAALSRCRLRRPFISVMESWKGSSWREKRKHRWSLSCFSLFLSHLTDPGNSLRGGKGGKMKAEGARFNWTYCFVLRYFLPSGTDGARGAPVAL